MNMWDIFDNREKAIIVWFFLFFTVMLFQADVRRSVARVIRVMLPEKILPILELMLGYIGLVVLLLYAIGLWNASLVMDTVIWFIGTGFVMFLNVNRLANGEQNYKSLVLDQFKLTLIVEFVLNFYTFDFIVEMILVPVLSFVAVLRVVTDSRESYWVVSRLIDLFMGIFAVNLLCYTLNEFLHNTSTLASSDALRVLLLPLILTLSYLPFLYCVSLYSRYEQLFIQVNRFLGKNEPLARFTKRRILLHCHVNLGKLNRFASENNRRIVSLQSQLDVLELLREFNYPRHTWQYLGILLFRITVFVLTIVII